MAEEAKEDSKLATDEALASTTSDAARSTSTEKSWGDKLKKQAFNKTTYVGINYFVNAIGSAIIGYVVERKFNKRFQSLSDNFGKKFGTTSHGAEKLSLGLFRGIRGFFLTLMGTLLVPVIKTFEDHRKAIQFRFGHWLDNLQEFLGQGNSASRQNIADYEKVKRAEKGKKDVEFTPEEKDRLWQKYHLETTDRSHSLVFKEHKLPWLKVIAARAFGWAAANATAYGLGFTDNNNNKWLRYKTYEKMAAPKLGGWLSKIPGFKAAVAEPTRFGEFLAQDFVMTVASSSTHSLVQGKLHKDGIEPKENSRKKILGEGPKDLKTRAEKATITPSLSV